MDGAHHSKLHGTPVVRKSSHHRLLVMVIQTAGGSSGAGTDA
jgi:hypothetical protein